MSVNTKIYKIHIVSHQDRMTDDQFFEEAIDHLERQHRQRRIEQMRVPIDSQKS